MSKIDEIEQTAVGLIRDAGRYGVYLTQLGCEVANVADWLESQVPRVRRTIHAMASAATKELMASLERRADGEER